MSLKLMRESCPKLSDLNLSGNKNIKNCANLQISKPKKCYTTFLLRLDLSHALQGDEQVF